MSRVLDVEKLRVKDLPCNVWNGRTHFYVVKDGRNYIVRPCGTYPKGKVFHAIHELRSGLASAS